MRFAPHTPGSTAQQAAQGARTARPRVVPQSGADLTQSERQALRLAGRRGGTTVSAPFRPKDRTQISHGVAVRLEAVGLLMLARASRVVLVRGAKSPVVTSTALPTKRGRTLLHETLPEHASDRNGIMAVPRLKHRHGITTRESDAVRGEDEVVASIEHRDRMAEQVRLAQRNRRLEAQRSAERARRAA